VPVQPAIETHAPLGIGTKDVPPVCVRVFAAKVGEVSAGETPVAPAKDENVLWSASS
jgi:hypothetical protein